MLMGVILYICTYLQTDVGILYFVAVHGTF